MSEQTSGERTVEVVQAEITQAQADLKMLRADRKAAKKRGDANAVELAGFEIDWLIGQIEELGYELDELKDEIGDDELDDDGASWEDKQADRWDAKFGI